MTRRTICILLILSIAILIFGCSKKDGEIQMKINKEEQNGFESIEMPEAGEEMAIIKTNLGDIRLGYF